MMIETDGVLVTVGEGIGTDCIVRGAGDQGPAFRECSGSLPRASGNTNPEGSIVSPRVL